MTQGGALVTDVRQVRIPCPECEDVVVYLADDPPKYAPYCSANCKCRGEGLRLCPCCKDLKSAESFQKPTGSTLYVLVCEDCAATCAICGLVQGTRMDAGQVVADPALLSDAGECMWCELLRMASIAWLAKPTHDTARRLVELIRELAPKEVVEAARR